jgi:hypothetical protein
MASTPEALRSVINEYMGGSEQRYRHALNRRLIYTAGIKALADQAGAYWLIDLVAFEAAPIYHKAWLAGRASIGILKLKVFTPEERAACGHDARLTLSLEDEAPDVFTHTLPATDFPVGEWALWMGTDEIGEHDYITTLYLPEEH